MDLPQVLNDFGAAVGGAAPPAVLGLIAGLVIQQRAHVLGRRAAKEDQKAASAIEMLDRCSEVFNARVKYVIAYNNKAPAYQRLREDYLDVKRRYRWVDPEITLVGTDAFNEWLRAERSARLDKEIPLEDRIKALEKAGFAVFDALAERRAKVREF